jgi:hypothetical protein
LFSFSFFLSFFFFFLKKSGLVMHRAKRALGAMARLSPDFAALFDRLETLFFLNETKGEQSIQTMALVNMGRLRFPVQHLAVATPFHSRVRKPKKREKKEKKGKKGG